MNLLISALLTKDEFEKPIKIQQIFTFEVKRMKLVTGGKEVEACLMRDLFGSVLSLQ